MRKLGPALTRFAAVSRPTIGVVVGPVVVLAVCSMSSGQECLLNPSFNDPPPLSGACSPDQQPVDHWYTADGTPWARRNLPVFPAACSCVTDDPAHATIAGWGNESYMIWQTVTGLRGDVRYMLHGVWWLGHMDPSGDNTARAELHDGTAAGPILDNGSGPQQAFAQRIQYQGSTDAWVPFTVVGNLPEGHNTITVVIKTTNTGVTGFATHVDCCSFFGIGPVDPFLVVTATSLTPCTRQGSNPPDDAITVYNEGGGTLNYTLTTDEAWVSVTPDSGTSRGESDTITVHYAAADEKPGTYNATITVIAPGATNSPQTIPVTLTVMPAPPDLDRDGDVDLGDFAIFQVCFNGPNQPYRSTCAAKADFDADRDVDLADFAVFQGCFNGPNAPPACTF